MANPEQIVIVGAGLAGAKTAEALREAEYAGGITIVGAEPDRPYERPGLSKSYLQGASEREQLFVHEPNWYRDNDVDLVTGRQVTAIDRADHRVQLATGEVLGYDKLMLATGARPRPLTIPGADLDGVHYLRTVADSEQLRETFGRIGSLAIIGGGWIGLEVAAAARTAGIAVTVIERGRLPLLSVLGPQFAPVLADLHRTHGVDLRTGVTVTEILADHGRAAGVLLDDGTRIAADAVLAAVGAVPNTGIADTAGLKVYDGIITDATLVTSDPDIYAAGDAARALHPRLNTAIRVEHWANALNQPRVAAAGMLGRPAEYDRLPYFYTDQYDLGMEYVGYTTPAADTFVVVRGDVSTGAFLAFWLDPQRRILAGMNVNVWDVNDHIRAFIESGRPVDAAALADPGTPLTELQSIPVR